MPPDPDPTFRPEPGRPERLAPGLRRVLAPNASPMTFRGTNSYILGEGEVAVIDPGPADPAHLEALLAALAPGERVTHILVTHAHLDHSPLARPLSERTGAPVLAHGDAGAGRSEVMEALARSGMAGGGEGVDAAFAPDERLADGTVVAGRDWQVEALHTPGHFGNHLSFAWGDAVFTGDLVMGWASSLVSPPDGDLTDFMASCERLAARDWRVFHPGHGAPVEAPAGRLAWLLEHRRGREAQILSALGSEPRDSTELAALIYTDTDPALLPAASRNVFAHLVDLAGRGLALPEGPIAATARFRRAD
ncbi:MBL fold metallo-hydrolase [Aquicoccus sp. SCR17]|nr:MBL fold metallo-hydrolase [Carideicomes alvinocaridis]